MNSELPVYDLLVVGGGINGAGIALDAAGRGLSVLLCEMNDLGSATSSNSSKLIHGGLRYLEYYEFRLVREALAEREVLLKKAPHIIGPLRFRLPHQPHLRPAWMIRAGLFLYDHLSKRTTLAGSVGIRFGADSPLIDSISKGFEYSDGQVDDARLVILNAIAAREKGAEICPRTRCVNASREGELWLITLEDRQDGSRRQVRCRALVNAAGPWVTRLFDETMSEAPPKQIRLVKGSHIIVPRLHDEPEAYILQNQDNRIVFVIPFEEQFSLIGTTDVEHIGDPSDAAISEQETDYLLDIANSYFRRQLSHSDIVSTFAGVRPLLDDDANSPQAVTRDYSFELDSKDQRAPLLSIFGGKITTYRKLAEAAVNALASFFPNPGPAWTAAPALPGGDFDDRQQLQRQLQEQYPWLPENSARRMVRSYGTRSRLILQNRTCLDQLGRHFGAGLYQAEVDYLVGDEWALTSEDILWRRSKLGLLLSDAEQQALARYLSHSPEPDEQQSEPAGEADSLLMPGSGGAAGIDQFAYSHSTAAHHI